jgi:hypothetical protein
METDYGVARLGRSAGSGKVGTSILDFHVIDQPGSPGSGKTNKGGAFSLIVENGTDQTIFVYRRWIRFAYEERAKRLRLEQRERQWVNTGSSADCHWFGGEYVQIRPMERVGLPQTAAFEYDKARIPPIGGGVEHVVLTLKELVVELAWSNKPLHWDGHGCNVERTKYLLPLEREVVTATIAL